MQDFNNKLFLCYSWEDINEIHDIIADFNHELNSNITVNQYNESRESLDKTIFPDIEMAEVVLVFISNASKNSQFVKDCVSHANHLNKKMIPIEIERSSIFSSMPEEFQFRQKSFNYGNEEHRAKLFSQIKRLLGTSVEYGDDYGQLVHIRTDMNAVVQRYGQVLCKAIVENDNRIRLAKGSHILEFILENDASVRVPITYEAKSNDGEGVIDVSLQERIQKIKEEEALRIQEAKIRKEYERKQLEAQLESERRIQEAELRRQEREYEEEEHRKEIQKKEAIRAAAERQRARQTTVANNDGCINFDGCGSVVLYIVIILVVGGLFSLM